MAAGFLAAGVAGCAGTEEARIARLVAASQTPDRFQVCHGSGCRVRSPVSLSDSDWSRVGALFRPLATDGGQERSQAAEAIGLIERLVASQAGTGRDLGSNNVVLNQSEQLDCVDETVNSLTYLRMMAKSGWLRQNRVGSPAHRGVILDGMYPHNTAVMVDEETGARYALDSYFGDNGAPAAAVPIDLWLAGWRSGKDGASF